MMKISAGDKAPEIVNVFIEIPKGTDVKYELDKESGLIFIDRFAATSMHYPCNYGFVPSTISGDGDPVDVLVLSEKTVSPGVILPARPIGMLEMEDESGIDAKVIAVPAVTGDIIFGEMTDINQVPQPLKDMIKHFFEHYKELEKGKWVKMKDWKGKETAIEEIKNGIANYK